MKNIDTLVEILDDTHVRVYRADGVTTVTDAQLPKLVGKRVLLTDPVHVFHARLPMPLQKKQIQPAVLASLVEDQLTSADSEFSFAGKVVGKQTDVAWMTHARLQSLDERFASIRTSLVGVVPTALMLTGNARDVIVHHAPWHYASIAREDDTIETLSVSENFLSVWQNTLAQPLRDVDLPEFKSILTNDLPVITFAKQVTPSRHSVGKTWLWACGLVVAVMALWGVNAYLDLQHANAQLREVKQAQVTVLKQVFPNTNNTSDPYGRLLSESSASQSVTFLTRVNEVLAKVPVTLREISASAQGVTLSRDMAVGGEAGSEAENTPFDKLNTALTEAGFSVTRTDNTLVVENTENTGSGNE